MCTCACSCARGVGLKRRRSLDGGVWCTRAAAGEPQPPLHGLDMEPMAIVIDIWMFTFVLKVSETAITESKWASLDAATDLLCAMLLVRRACGHSLAWKRSLARARACGDRLTDFCRCGRRGAVRARGAEEHEHEGAAHRGRHPQGHHLSS
jgi:hypothetical protein